MKPADTGISIGDYGYRSRIREVHLGTPNATTCAYGAVHDRSDLRDATDVRETSFGLEFIEMLRPVDYRHDYRDAYVEEDGTAAPRDGSRSGKRFHHGLIAQDVKAAMDALGKDFGGYQDHEVNGGDDLLTLGYGEFIAPLIKAVQELSGRLAALEQERGTAT